MVLEEVVAAMPCPWGFASRRPTTPHPDLGARRPTHPRPTAGTAAEPPVAEVSRPVPSWQAPGRAQG